MTLNGLVAGVRIAGALLLCAGAGRTALAQLPVVTPGGVVNGATFTAPVVAGSLASIFGSNLAGTAMPYGGVQPVPQTLAGTTVKFMCSGCAQSYAAPLYFVSPGQINLQVPWEVGGPPGVTVTVTTSSGTSSPVAVNTAAYAPALFSANTNLMGEGAIANFDNTANSASDPTVPGGIVQLLATNLGAVNVTPADGTAPPANDTTKTPVTATIGGLPATVTSAALCGSTSICQDPDSSYMITVQVPQNVALGNAVEVVVSEAPGFSNTVTMAIALNSFFTTEVGLGDNIFYMAFPNNNVFGYYSFSLGSGGTSNAWMYHFDMGYEYLIPESGGSMYMYDLASNHWWYTSSSLFPYLYDFTLNAWLYYFPNTQMAGHYSTNPRYFSNLTTGMIFTM
jgi:uncharacterized protein (TIGR03437 family)